MKLIDIIGKVILEQLADDERVDDVTRDEERPDDETDPFDIPTDDTIFEFPTESDRKKYCLDLAGMPDVEIPPVCVDIIRREREEPSREEPSREEPSREEPRREDPPREEEPATTTQPFELKKVQEPRKTLTRKAPPEKKQTTTSSPIKTTQKKEVKVNPQYSSDADIKNINQARPLIYVEKVKNTLEKQLALQPPQIKQRLAQLNVTPEIMANLIPLSTESGVLMTKMELDGLNLPLMMVLYNNTPALYKSMTNNNPLKQNDVKPITRNINYVDFWKWNEDVYTKWGDWLKSNVVGNFPNIAKSNLPSLSF